MQLVAALMTDRPSGADVTRALRPHVHVEACPNRRRLLALLRRVDVAAVIIELRSSRSDTNAAFITTLRQQHPALPIIGAVRLRPDELRDIVVAARKGITDVLVLGHEDPWLVVRTFVSGAADARRAVLDALSPIVPACAWPVVEYCVANARRGLGADQLARAFGVPRKTLDRRLARGGLPGPATTLTWIRLLLV